MNHSWLPLLFTYEIRRYYPRGSFSDNWACWFNLAEAAAWFMIAGLVFVRWRKNRRSHEELLYAGLFIAFGLSDVREAFVLQTWLLWVKAAIFAGIVWLRHRLHRQHYPGWKTY